MLLANISYGLYTVIKLQRPNKVYLWDAVVGEAGEALKPKGSSDLDHPHLNPENPLHCSGLQDVPAELAPQATPCGIVGILSECRVHKDKSVAIFGHFPCALINRTVHTTICSNGMLHQYQGSESRCKISC